MPGIDKQWYFSISLADVGELPASDISDFLLIEEAGTSLPTFSLIINATNPDLIKQAVAGKTFTVRLGIDQANAIESELIILPVVDSPNPRGVGGGFVVKGYLNNPDWISRPDMGYYEEMKVEEVMEQVAEMGGAEFFLDQMKPTEVKQNWIQPNITPQQFFNELILHSMHKEYTENWFLSYYGIDGFLTVRDWKRIEKYMKGDYRVIADTTTMESNGKVKRVDGVLTTGIRPVSRRPIQEISILSKSSPRYDFSDYSYTNTKAEATYTMTDPEAFLISGDRRFPHTFVDYDYVYPEWDDVYKHHLKTLAQHETVLIECNLMGSFSEIELLWPTLLMSHGMDGNKETLLEKYAGFYLPVKKVYSISGDTYIEKIVLGRCGF